MYERFLPSRRRFLQGGMGLLGLVTAGPLRRVFAGPRVRPPDVGTHLVVMTVVDKDHTWSAQAHVGDDPTVAAKWVKFTDANGKPHRGLEAWFYADCCEAGATSLANAYDFINIKSVTVTYDGRNVPVPPSSKKDGTFDFWRGCRCPAIRYGKQIGWSKDKIDWSLLPSYSRHPQKPWNDSRMDYSFNGLGNATTTHMGDGGSRPDIGYMSVWNLAFLTNPSDETWATLRRIEDHIGWWSMVYTSDPDTGRIVDMYKYPGTTLSPQAQVHGWKSNPVAPYGGSYDGDTLIVGKGGPLSWSTTGSPFLTSNSHLTSYAMAAAMITGTARDRDHASFWGNYPILSISVPFFMKKGVMLDTLRTAAWCLRNLFMASHISSDREYFAKATAHNLPIAMAHTTNPFGAYDVHHAYPRIAIKNGGQIAFANWQQYYLMTTLDAVAHKNPMWMPFAKFLAKFMATWAQYPFVMCASIGSFTVKQTAPDGKTQTTMDDFPEQLRRSLLRFGYTVEQARAVVSAKTQEEAYDVLKAASASKAVQRGAKMYGTLADGVSDMIGFVGPNAYPAMAQAAMVCAYNTGAPGTDKVLEYWEKIPTKADYSRNSIYNLVPRASINGVESSNAQSVELPSSLEPPKLSSEHA